MRRKKHSIVIVCEGSELRVVVEDAPWIVTKRAKPEQAVRVILAALGIHAEVIAEDWDKKR